VVRKVVLLEGFLMSRETPGNLKDLHLALRHLSRMRDDRRILWLLGGTPRLRRARVSEPLIPKAPSPPGTAVPRSAGALHRLRLIESVH
jgi:hypothetical protein